MNASFMKILNKNTSILYERSNNRRIFTAWSRKSSILIHALFSLLLLRSLLILLLLSLMLLLFPLSNIFVTCTTLITSVFIMTTFLMLLLLMLLLLMLKLYFHKFTIGVIIFITTFNPLKYFLLTLFLIINFIFYHCY